MYSRTYFPFRDEKGQPKSIYELEFLDLKQIKENEIEEGPFIEYKREFSGTVKSKIPNFITSFANEQGGWFIIGIDETTMDINLIEKKDYELQINNILRSNTSPVPRIVTRFLSSDEDSNLGVLVIFIPESNNPPHISKGKIYRRIGSGSSPIKEVEDRYFLDKLYEKSDRYIESLTNFCKKEISIENTVYHKFSASSYDRGICSIYLIPEQKFDILENIEGDKFIDLAKDESKKIHSYDLSGHATLNINLPFETVNYSHQSIVFRNSNLLDNYSSTVAWEQFLDGSAKFHMPVPYLNSELCIQQIGPKISNIHDLRILDEFEYINGIEFTNSIIGCLSTYLQTMKKVNKDYNDIIIAIELNNVRNDVLIFDTPNFYKSLNEDGLKFSDRNNYFINNKFISTEIIEINGMELLTHIGEIMNAFGWGIISGSKLLLEQMTGNQLKFSK